MSEIYSKVITATDEITCHIQRVYLSQTIHNIRSTGTLDLFPQ